MYKYKHSLPHIQDLIPTLAGIKYISDITPAKLGMKFCGYNMLENAYICTCVWLRVELIVTTSSC